MKTRRKREFRTQVVLPDNLQNNNTGLIDLNPKNNNEIYDPRYIRAIDPISPPPSSNRLKWLGRVIAIFVSAGYGAMTGGAAYAMGWSLAAIVAITAAGFGANVAVSWNDTPDTLQQWFRLGIFGYEEDDEKGNKIAVNLKKNLREIRHALKGFALTELAAEYSLWGRFSRWVSRGMRPKDKHATTVYEKKSLALKNLQEHKTLTRAQQNTINKLTAELDLIEQFFDLKKALYETRLKISLIYLSSVFALVFGVAFFCTSTIGFNKLFIGLFGFASIYPPLALSLFMFVSTFSNMYMMLSDAVKHNALKKGWRMLKRIYVPKENATLREKCIHYLRCFLQTFFLLAGATIAVFACVALYNVISNNMGLLCRNYLNLTAQATEWIARALIFVLFAPVRLLFCLRSVTRVTNRTFDLLRQGLPKNHDKITWFKTRVAILTLFMIPIIFLNAFGNYLLGREGKTSLPEQNEAGGVLSFIICFDFFCRFLFGKPSQQKKVAPSNQPNDAGNPYKAFPPCTEERPTHITPLQLPADLSQNSLIEELGGDELKTQPPSAATSATTSAVPTAHSTPDASPQQPRNSGAAQSPPALLHTNLGTVPVRPTAERAKTQAALTARLEEAERDSRRSSFDQSSQVGNLAFGGAFRSTSSSRSRSRSADGNQRRRTASDASARGRVVKEEERPRTRSPSFHTQPRLETAANDPALSTRPRAATLDGKGSTRG